jgi:hypothetical protein
MLSPGIAPNGKATINVAAIPDEGNDQRDF